MPAEVTVTNFPTWTLYFIAGSQIIFALAMAAIAFVMISLLGQLKEILGDTKKMTEEANRNLPSMLGSVNGTLKNVKSISDDANATVHNVTGTVNRVSHVVGSVAGRMESPVIRAVGALSGVAAGMRAFRGPAKKEVIAEKETKRKGRFGFFK
ncbi:MAG: hypothetical protein JWN98_717 [Abditibacteriota bacterium]|nr:hypothetical protein [Abditibacteriota bacterium]